MAVLTSSAKINLSAAVTMLCLTTVCMAGRFGVRLYLRQRPLGADWVCLLSLAFFGAYCAVIIDFIFRVSQFHAFDADFNLGLAEIQNLLKASYILEILMSYIITTAKLSLLWFYHIIFCVDKRTKFIIWGVAVGCSLWFVTVLFVLIFQCSPVDAMWTDINFATKCHDTPRMLLGYEVTNLLLDGAILVIPIFSIKQLQLTKPKRISIIGVFMLGGFVCVASILRLVAIYDLKDPSRPVDFTSGMLWSTIQLGVALICCCIPTLAPLLRLFTKLYSSWQTFYKYSNYKDSSKVTGRKDEEGDDPSWIRLEDGHQISHSRVYSNHHNSQDHILREIPSKGIMVERGIDVQR